MRFIIPELEGYFGGKSGSGVYQNIINQIPPHRTLAIPFLGHCGILRNIKWPERVIASDIDPFVIECWNKHCKSGNIDLYNEDWFKFICSIFDEPDTVIYLDPPYPHCSRKSNHRYKFEMSDNDHFRLLNELNRFKYAKILISTYKNFIYTNMLSDWNHKTFTARTRGGVAKETLFWNFEGPERLHDYSYFGRNYKQREHFKLKKERLIAKFEGMSSVEQGFYLEALNQVRPLVPVMYPERK